MHIGIITGGSILSPFLKQQMNTVAFDYLIAADKGLQACYELQLMPDIMLGDFDSVSEEVLSFYRDKQVEQRVFPARKDDTDTELALHAAFLQCPDRITVYGATGSRIDHVLSNISILRKGLEKDVFIELLDENNRIYLIKDSCEIPKDKQYGKYVSLLPMTEKVEGVTLTGFRYTMANGCFVQGDSLGVSNQIEEDYGRIKIEKGILIIIESKD